VSRPRKGGRHGTGTTGARPEKQDSGMKKPGKRGIHFPANKIKANPVKKKPHNLTLARARADPKRTAKKKDKKTQSKPLPDRTQKALRITEQSDFSLKQPGWGWSNLYKNTANLKVCPSSEPESRRRSEHMTLLSACLCHSSINSDDNCLEDLSILKETLDQLLVQTIPGIRGN